MIAEHNEINFKLIAQRPYKLLEPKFSEKNASKM